VIVEAVEHFDNEGWTDENKAADWISNRAAELRDGGIDKRTAVAWAKKAADVLR
jgi:hypothetical protein